MIEIENESKYVVQRNFDKLEKIVTKLALTNGFEIISTEIKQHIDAYLDFQNKLFEAGYTLRKRYSKAELKDITLKSIGTIDTNGNTRIEEKAKDITNLKKKVIHKLKTIYQAPKDESVYQILGNFSLLEPVIVITKIRKVLKVGKGKNFCEVCLDRFSYLLPMDDGVYLELEIEGSSQFDNFRKIIEKRLTGGRWPTLEHQQMSKFERGMKLGGLI